jgi:peptide/nickel transport system substrate-binding protein
MNRRFIHPRHHLVGASALAVAALVLAGCSGSSSNGVASPPAATGASSSSSATTDTHAVLTMESSEQNAITRNFNPYVPSSAATLLGAVSMMYEPLIQFDVVKPGTQYPWLATSSAWSNGGKTITFTIRSGVKWSDGSPLTANDVAFTFNLLKKYTDINTQGLAIASATASGNQAVINFTSPQYTNFENIAGQIYIVPSAVWSKVGDPAKYVDADPVGSGPYTLTTYTNQGITLSANPTYWGGAPAVGKVEFPVIAANNTVLAQLHNNQLDWAGNFLTGLQQSFLNGQSNHAAWFAPVNTNSLEPNLNTFPTNQLAVRKAISLAIDRTQISKQGEGGLEPPTTNASGLVLPNFASALSPAAKSLSLSLTAQPAAAKKELTSAGYTMGSDGFFRDPSGREVKLAITNPSDYSDYAEDDTIAAGELRAAGIDATFQGQSDNAWAADVADGDFQLTGHWSQTSISPYQLYNNWLNSSLANTSNAAGDYERLKSTTVDTELATLAKAQTPSAQQTALAPLENYVATQLPIIPTVYGAAFDEYNTGSFSGWPTATNDYESGSPNAPTNEVVVLHLKPTS